MDIRGNTKTENEFVIRVVSLINFSTPLLYFIITPTLTHPQVLYKPNAIINHHSHEFSREARSVECLTMSVHFVRDNPKPASAP